MDICSKKTAGFLTGIFIFILFCVVLFSLPFIAYAQTGTLGSEKPEIYCTYYQDGNEIDGNSLTAGTYDVSFMVSGVENISVIEVTASYDETVTVADTPVALMSDEVAGMQSMGYLIGDGEMVFGFVSQNEDATPCNSEDVLIASLQVTFAQDCDAADVITAQTHPNLTFIQADYNDGYEDCYSIDMLASDYTGNIYPMSCDITPEFGHNVSGSLVVMTDAGGTTKGTAVYGEYTIDVYSDIDRTDLVTSVTSSYQTDENNENINTFNIPKLAIGTYYVTVSSVYALTREDITIVVSGSDISGAVIPVMACDFDQDKGISALDASLVYSAMTGKFDADYCDLDGDGGPSTLDASIVYSCCSGTLHYPEIVIE